MTEERVPCRSVLTADVRAVEGAVAGIAQVARDQRVFAEPLKLILPHVTGLSHTHLAQVIAILLLRFHSTSLHADPSLEALGMQAEQAKQQVLDRLQQCLDQHRSFQSAVALAPLLHQMLAITTQCCAVAVRDEPATAAAFLLQKAMATICDVLSNAVLDRVEHFRPIHAARVSGTYDELARHQDEMAQFSFGDAQRDLSSLPKKPKYTWRNKEFEQFWDMWCARYDGPVPTDTLAALMLRAVDVEASLVNSQAVMLRLRQLGTDCVVACESFDACGPEARRCGGLRAWVRSLLATSGGTSGTIGARTAGQLGCSRPAPLPTLESTWHPSSARSARRAFSARGPTTITPRISTDRLKSFALSAPIARNSEGGCRLFDSVEKNSLKASQRLILGDGVSPNSRHATFHDTPLHAAAMQDKSYAPVASLLLSRGADVNAGDKNLATPLHVAASTGHRGVAKELIRNGADVRREDRWRATPLHKAAANGQVELTELLLHHGASASVSDEWGATPLHRAAARGQLGVVERLLQQRADLNAEDHCGEQPLHVAARHGNYALVRLFLEHGGNPDVRSRLAGKTPEEAAQERGHRDVVTLLQHRNEWVTVAS
uniref:Uncharacterized protein n=1 Tax=Noctiluca scintillans TaxID=2966 RepID=A0A7S1AKE3_NOCSC